MSSVFVPSPLLLRPPAVHQSALCLNLRPQYNCCFHNLSSGQCLSFHSFLSPIISFHSLHNRLSSIGATTPPNEGAISVINFEDFVEKDWSFLDTDDTNSDEQIRKTDQIIYAGEIKGSSKVLVSIGSEGFVDQIVSSSPCQLLLIVHDSLLVLACIKEKYDMVKCWQGELIYVPEKWAPFDVVFLYFLPALPFKLDQVVQALAKLCLPDKMTLQNVAAGHSFQMIEFVDEPGFYLAVLKFKEKDSGK